MYSIQLYKADFGDFFFFAKVEAALHSHSVHDVEDVRRILLL